MKDSKDDAAALVDKILNECGKSKFIQDAVDLKAKIAGGGKEPAVK